MMPVARPRQRLSGRASALPPVVAAQGDAATLLLDQRGMIRGCNSASETLFGYRRGELVWQHVSMLLPQLAGIELLQNGQLNPRLLFLCRIGSYFQALSRDGECFASDLFLLNLANPGSSDLRLMVRRNQPV